MAKVFNVSIQSEINEFPTEKRYDSQIKISELRKKLELITGADHKTMKIELHLNDNQVTLLDNDDQTLESYVSELSDKETILKLVVKDEQSKALLNGDVPKYTISEEKYQSIPNNARNFIKELKEKRASGNHNDTDINK